MGTPGMDATDPAVATGDVEQHPEGESTAEEMAPKPVPWAPAAAGMSATSNNWIVPHWMKIAFFWGSVATLAGLITHKVLERQRYEEILVDTVMDPTPMSGTAPPFTLPAGPDAPAQSLSDYKGRWVLVNFWATWCPPCREEMPSMEFLTRKFGNRMAVLAVTVDEDWNEVKRFFGADAPSFKLLWDSRRQVTRAYGTEKFPETYLVSPDGRVVTKFIGPRDWNSQAAEEYFRKLLGG